MTSKLIGKLLRILIPSRAQGQLNWEMDADAARLEQEPLRARLLLYTGLLVIVLLLIWSALVEIDEVTRGDGKVIPSRQVQMVQAVDGGIVSEIVVQEGETVEAGQVLMRIDPTRFVASLRENRVQYFALLAKAERLTALAEDRPFEPPPELGQEGASIIEQERALYESSRRELDAQIGVIRLQLQQRNEEFRELRALLGQLEERQASLRKELEVTRPLLGSGAVSEVELLRLEREMNEARGEREQVLAQIDRTQAAVGEMRRKIQEVALAFANQARRELSEVMARINSLLEGQASLQDRVKHANVKAPMRGTVKTLHVTTQGAVVQPGETLADIVPLDDSLVLDVRILPKDIGFLRPGLAAQVKFTAYEFAVYGSLEAKVEQIGADTVTDERGQSFYLVKVRTLKSSLGENLPIIPGMMAQVDIITGQKSLLSYLLRPILRAKGMAFRER